MPDIKIFILAAFEYTLERRSERKETLECVRVNVLERDLWRSSFWSASLDRALKTLCFSVERKTLVMRVLYPRDFPNVHKCR